MNTRRLLISCFAVLLLGGSATLAASSTLHQRAGSVIAACANASGRLRLIDPGGRCRGHERLITWNVQGPKGDVGPAGPAGPAGADGAPGPAGPAGAT